MPSTCTPLLAPRHGGGLHLGGQRRRRRHSILTLQMLLRLTRI